MNKHATEINKAIIVQPDAEPDSVLVVSEELIVLVMIEVTVLTIVDPGEIIVVIFVIVVITVVSGGKTMDVLVIVVDVVVVVIINGGSVTDTKTVSDMVKSKTFVTTNVKAKTPGGS